MVSLTKWQLILLVSWASVAGLSAANQYLCSNFPVFHLIGTCFFQSNMAFPAY